MAEYRLNKLGQIVDGKTGDVLRSNDVPDHIRRRLQNGSVVIFTHKDAQNKARATMQELSQELSKRIKSA